MARYEFLTLLLFFNSGERGRGGGGMEMLDRMGLARLVNPYFKITVLEISGRPVVRSSETIKKFTGQPIFGKIKGLVAQGGK